MGDRVKDQVIANWEQKVLDKFGNSFELISVSGTKESGERTITVKCLTCGTVKAVSSISFRGENGKHGHCDICQVRLTEKRHQVAEQLKQAEKDRRKIKNRLKAKQVGFRLCECGAILAYHCSLCDECRAKHKSEYSQKHSYKKYKELWYKAEKKRVARLKGVKSDKDATLKALYEKYNGVCYLCGEFCDWNDGEWKNGIFYAYGRYPSRDHVIALANGGDDTWSNLRLAHLSCNASKGTKNLNEDAPHLVG